jgi:transcriptional regulator GlxA family with amidase domain
VNRRLTPKVSPIEEEVAAEIRALRTSPLRSERHTSLLQHPERLAHHFILASHGSTQLRLGALARELGVEMRTLERTFISEYNKTMTQIQVETRLAFAQYLLGIFPPAKVSVVAAQLGYSRVQDFNRFFKKYLRQAPSAWGIKERDRIAREIKAPSEE